MIQIAMPAAAALIGLLLGFQLTIGFIPPYIMSKTLEQFEVFGGAYNSQGHAPPIDETSRSVVRPSPDILYSGCMYDLSQGPLSITMPELGHGALAVLSFYDARTNNFYRIDNHSFPEGVPIPPLLLTQDDSQEGEFIVHSPSETGLVLYRRILSGGVSIEAADTTRQGFVCGVSD